MNPRDGPKTLSYGVVWTCVPYLNYLGGGATPQQAARKSQADFCRPDGNRLAGCSISLPATEIGWLAARPRFLSQHLLLYLSYINIIRLYINLQSFEHSRTQTTTLQTKGMKLEAIVPNRPRLNELSCAGGDSRQATAFSDPTPPPPVPRHPLTGVRADCEHPNATHETRQCPSHTSHELPPSTVQRCLHEHPRAHSSGHVRLPPSTKSRTSKVSPEPHPASRKQALRQVCCSSRLE